MEKEKWRCDRCIKFDYICDLPESGMRWSIVDWIPEEGRGTQPAYKITQVPFVGRFNPLRNALQDNGPVAALPSDSGYASMNPNLGPKIDKADKDGLDAAKPEEALSMWDAQTLYSDEASVDTTRRDCFVEKFAETLFKDLAVVKINTEHANLLCNGLKELLAEFALRLNQQSSTAELRRALMFIHKYRM